MKQKKGWNPLPFSLKVLSVFLSINIVYLVYSFKDLSQLHALTFGFHLTGRDALFSLLFFGVLGSVILLVGFWNRDSWTWKYGIAYFSIIILGGIISLLKEIVNPPLEFTDIPLWEMLVLSIPAFILGLGLYIVAIVLIFIQRNYCS